MTTECAQHAPSLLVTNATFLTMRPGEDKPFKGYMLVNEEGKIAAIGPGDPPDSPNGALDASGKIIIPGFVSAHSHLYQSAFRGLGVDHNTPEWRADVGLYSNFASGEDLYWFSLHGALDHLAHGITSVFNFGINGRADAVNELQMRGILESGMRCVHAYANSRALPVDEQYERFTRYHDFTREFAADPRFLRLGITGSGDSLEHASFDKRLMDDFGVLNQTHFLSEAYRLTRDGRRLGKDEVQKGFENFIDAGTLGPNQIFGHFIHTNDWILEKTAASGSGMAWQPLSNGRLGSGIADIPKYLQAGVKVGMGVDGEASADIADPFENMRMGLYFIRASYGAASAMRTIDVMRIATIGSAELMGVADKVGSLEIGKYADFAIISPPAPVFDAVAMVVLAVNCANIDSVFVGGRKVVDQGSFVQSDAGAVAGEVDGRIARLRTAAQPRLAFFQQ
jgi:5-methylthioadenosine/S-adenosylhomocysteine deaminase